MPTRLPARSNTERTSLPQDHEYQRTLRKYMASLTEKDFNHGVAEKLPIDKPTDTNPEYLYRQYILTLMHQPMISGVSLDDGMLTVRAADYGAFSQAVAGVARDAGIRLHEMLPTDESLESVFSYLVRGPSAR